MTKKQIEEKVKKLFTQSAVVYATSDGVTFFEESFARNHANKNGLEVHVFKKPKKKLKDGAK